MIRITKQADYAIILLGHFVSDSDAVSWNARDLASHTRLPSPMVGKILKTLARRGLLESHRGAKGGYRLARKPEQISVVEIITAVDGPIGLTSCSAVSGCCEYEPACPARSNWHLINRAVLAALKDISLREMARPEVRSAPAGSKLDIEAGPGLIATPFKKADRLNGETVGQATVSANPLTGENR